MQFSKIKQANTGGRGFDFFDTFFQKSKGKLLLPSIPEGHYLAGFSFKNCSFFQFPQMEHVHPSTSQLATHASK